MILQLTDQIRENNDRKVGHLFKVSSQKNDYQINWFKLWAAFESAKIIDKLPLNIAKKGFEDRSFVLKVDKTWAELEATAKQMAGKYIADQEFDDPKDKRFKDKAGELKDRKDK